MVNCLRGELLYTEKRARDLLFSSIERLLSTDTTFIVARLTRDAGSGARLAAEQSGYAFTNWTAAGSAVVKALLCSDSLLGPDGHSIPYAVTAHAATVAALRTDYRDRTEAFLIEVLLKQLGDVTVRDHTAIAHALFRQFDPNVPMETLEDRVAILIAGLAGRVSLDGSVYRVHG